MGFSVAETGAAMAFAHSFGAKHQVTNIGAGIRACTPGVTVTAYFCSHLHEVRKPFISLPSMNFVADDGHVSFPFMFNLFSLRHQLYS
jgi:hypothetical protein